MESAKVLDLARGVAREVAEAEFERFCEAMDLDIDASRMDADDIKGFEEVKAVIVRAIERQHVVIDDRGQPVFTPQSGDGRAITFYEPTGATFMATDAHKKGHDVAKMIAVLADMTRTDAKTFAKLASRDFKVCQTFVKLFLG